MDIGIIDLFGEEDLIITDKSPKKTKKVLEKIDNSNQSIDEVDVSKILKSKKTSLTERLSLINQEVERVLGHYRSNTLIIRDKDTLHQYIDKCIINNLISVDTETNNSLDPITCKIMGLCIHTPGMSQAYVPINHININTNELLPNQVTEQDLNEELSRLSNTYTIMHNGKFDYQVIKCTCNVEMRIDWDTMIGAKLLDENELSAGLKQQYIDKIDKTQEKYDIEALFKNVEYAQVDPDIFALYSATDAYMTYMLYLYQKEKFELKENEKLLSLMTNIEMPCVKVVAEMELTGIELDLEYSERLKKKYHKKLAELQVKIDEELLNLKPKIDMWRLTAEANKKDLSKKNAKSKNEQLEEHINLGSPTQLAILLYDVLKVGEIDKKQPRATGTEILEKIKLPICELIIEQKELSKLISAFIDSLPENVNQKDNRIHCHFNQYGAKTGRFSSSEPNLQQIPSHNKEIRMLFKATTKEHIVDLTDNYYKVYYTDEVLTSSGWKFVKDIVQGDILFNDDTQYCEEIESIIYNETDKCYYLVV